MVDFKELTTSFAEIADYMWQRGWGEMNAGNFSAELTAYSGLPEANTATAVDVGIKLDALEGKKLWITAAGSRMRDMSKNMDAYACIVSVEHGRARISWKAMPGGRPSSELPSHLAVHNMLAKQGREGSCLVHAHPTELIALSHLPELGTEEKINELLWGMHTEILDVLPYGLSYVPFSIPGTGELATASAKALKEKPLALWEKHGCYALAENPGLAFDLIDVANKAARIYFTCATTGKQPEGINNNNLSLLKSYYQNREQT